MACYVSAGHHLKDPGAIANGLQENKLTIRVRDKVISFLKQMGVRVIIDDDKETLAQYLNRIKPGDGSVVIEFHFDAANPTATGTSAFYADGANQNSISFAHDLAKDGEEILEIKNRGAHSESDSHRGRLGLVHTKAGISALVEICFISNPSDIEKFEANFEDLCKRYAETIFYYEQLVP